MSKPTPKELQRLRALLQLEEAARRDGYRLIAGVDEAGRGPLAGPVVAAACILPTNALFPGINDSKKLSSAQRKQLFESLLAAKEISYGIGIVNPDIIDNINILQATIHAMKLAIAELPTLPDYLLVDGMNIPNCSIPHSKEIKGDGRSQSIAAASIIAKETRDRIMIEYDEHWPEYGFAKHKGYPTAAHLDAIERHGPCPIHRMSFEPFKSMELVLCVKSF